MTEQSDSFFYHEMMVHPAIFTHAHPKTVLIVGHGVGILEEVLKHPAITEVVCLVENKPMESQDKRVTYYAIDTLQWLAQCKADSFDIIIEDLQLSEFLENYFKQYYRILRADGILVKPCQSALLQPKVLIPLFQNVKQAGFTQWQTLNFPQPSYSQGWRTIMLATKNPHLKRIREKDIYNRTFGTRYYNLDTHKAALALPEFMRLEWSIE